MRKIIKRIFIIMITLMLLTTVNCFAADEELNIKELVEKEEGSLFDKTIAKTIRRNCTSCSKHNNR